MSRQHSDRVRSRDLWRIVRHEKRKERRYRQRLRRGQTLIIFALSFTVLLGLAGLAVDVARMYDLYARMQRAAEAGALAGVLYLPNYYSTAMSPGDGLDAVTRATMETVKNGFGTVIPVGQADCPTPVGSVEVAVCQVPGQTSDLQVTITERLSLVLLAGLGVTPVTLQATAQSEYLPPIQVGSRGIFFGDQVECSPGNSQNLNLSSCSYSDTSNVHVQDFMATFDGPAELAESGDPYVYCMEGPGQLSPPAADPTSAPATYNGYGTDHPQNPGVTNGWSAISQYCGEPVPGGKPGNPYYQPDGYNGPATANSPHPGGYNYYVGITNAVSTASLWIFNPYYSPTNWNTNPPPLDHFIDNGASNFYHGPLDEGLGQTTPFNGRNYDAPLFYFNTTFSLYQVNSLYDRSSDTLIASEQFTPLDGISADLSAHSCASGQLYNPTWSNGNTQNTYYHPNGITPGGGCLSSPLALTLSPNCTWVMQWCQLYNATSGLPVAAGTPVTLCGAGVPCPSNGGNPSTGIYRLVVEATGITAKTNIYNSQITDGWGQHAYSLKLCAGDPSTPINCNDGSGSNGVSDYNNPPMYIFAWNNMDVTFQAPLTYNSPNPNYPQSSCVTSNTYGYACMDLGCIPTAYAGRTVTISLYDPGDGVGNLFLGIAPPQGAGSTTVSYPSYLPTYTYDGEKVFQAHYANGYRPLNGLWVDITLTLGPNYEGDCVTTSGKSGYSGWWQLIYLTTDASGSGSQPTDKLAVSFTLVGSPVHLVPLG